MPVVTSQRPDCQVAATRPPRVRCATLLAIGMGMLLVGSGWRRL